MRNNSFNYFEYGPVVQEEKPFKCIPYLELWQLFCSMEQKHLSNFGGGYYEKQFCEIILSLGQWFRSCCFKDFLSSAFAVLLFDGGGPFIQI